MKVIAVKRGQFDGILPNHVERNRLKVPQPRSRGILGDEASVASQLGFGGAQLVRRGAVAGALRDMVVVARDGEGLVCDGFKVSLWDVS
jgi:hypothetical protein